MNSRKSRILPGTSYILLLLFISLPLSGQKRRVDAVYLNNGEVYRGRILEQPDQEKIHLETLCLNTRMFPTKDISHIGQEKVDLMVLRMGGHASARGYFNYSDLGFLLGSGSNEKNAILSIQMVNGYKFGRKYFAGIGTGIEFFEQAYIPLFADFSYMLTENRVSPFLTGSMGYTFSIDDPPEQWGARTNNLGGMMYSVGIGTSIRTGMTSSFAISLEYRYQNLRSDYTEDWNEDVLHFDKQYNRLSLRLGFVFD
jgi:hypothetical protein